MDYMDKREARKKEIKDIAYEISFLKKENLRLLKNMARFQSGKLRMIDKIFLGFCKLDSTLFYPKKWQPSAHFDGGSHGLI